MKKWVLLLIAVLMILLILPVHSMAAGEEGSAQESPSVTQEPRSTDMATLQELGLLEGGLGTKPEIPEKDSLSEAEEKLSTSVLQLMDNQYLPEGMTQGELIDQMEDQEQIAEVPVTSGAEGLSSGYEVYVYIQLADGSDFNVLTPYVSRIENQDEEYGLAAAWVDISMLKSLANLDEVQSVREVTAPVVYSGSVLSEGDATHQANLVRSQTGADGTGVKIGIISDGVDHWTDARNSGNLPTNVTVLSNKVHGDEGTAMLEIVYDLAPGAQLYFHDCGDNILAFNEAITALADAGCTVICDDIGWIAEPFFEDGLIADHVANIIATRGITYVTAAGNSAQEHYQGLFYNDGSDLMDFSRGTSSTPDLYAYVPAGDTITVIMQWNEPFGGSSSDYDMYLVDVEEGYLLSYSEETQDGNDDPLEGFSWENNTGSDKIVAILAAAYDAPVNKILEIYVYGAGMYTNNIVLSDSIFGHAAVPGVISCGAIDYSTPNTIEGFSSRGPVTMLSGTRQKPDICGIDGVSVTGVGGFGSPFYGTSAAAPHIAAIAALLQSRFPSLTAVQTKNLILNYGVDLGSSGYDSVYGYGRGNALAAALSSLYVKFDSRGGSTVASQLIPSGGKAVKPVDPVRPGGFFEGWYKEPTCINEWDFDSDTVTGGDVTLYAKWQVSVITADANNTSYGTVSGGGTYITGETVTLTATPRAGCRFVSWKEGATQVSTNAVYTFTAVDDSNFTAEFAAIGVPADLAALTSYDSIQLTWSAVEGAIGYEVWRSTTASGTYKNIKTISGTSYTDTGLATGITYYYKVNAYCTASTATTYGSPSLLSATPTLLASDGVAAVSAGYDSVRVSWNSVVGASGYELYRASSSGGSYSLIKTTTSLSYTNTGLNTGTTYYYKVRAYRTVSGKKVYSDYSDIVSAMPALSPVTSVTASPASPTSVKVSWGAVAGRTKYEVWRSTEEDGTYTRVTTTTSTSYTNTGLAPFTTYYYQIKVYRTAGGLNVYAEDPAPITASARPILNNVANVTAAMYSVTSNKISWSSVSSRTGYEVWWSESADSGFALLTSPTSNYTSTSFTHKNTDPTKTYYYKVIAYVTVGGVRHYSAESSAVPAYNKVSGAKAAMYTVTSVKVSWSAVSSRKGYEVVRCNADGSGESLVKTTTSTYLTVTNLIPNQTYYFKVRAYQTISGVKVYSGYSDVISAMPVFNNVSNVKAAMYSVTSNKISWSAVSGRTGYEVWWSESADSGFARLTSATSNYTSTYIYHKNIDPAKTYYYKVVAYVTVGGARQYSAESTAVPAYNQVNGVKGAMYAVTSNKISWSSVSSRSGYEVWWSETADGIYTMLPVTTSTYTYHKSIDPTKTYYYKVRAYQKISGVNVYSGYSEVIAVTNKVNGATAAMYSVTSNKISWSAVSGRDGYELYRCDAAGNITSLLKTTTSTSYTDSGLTTDTTYYYRVRAYDTVGGVKVYSGYSDVVSATPSLKTVTGAKASRYNSTKIKLTWSKVSGATGYEIQRCTTGDAEDFEPLITTTSSSYYNSGLTTGTRYYYRIRAYRTVGGVTYYGGWSTVVSATP